MNDADDMAHALAPRLGPAPRVLVLGSMPGRESLRRSEYYATARNRFWPLMEELLGVPRDLPYAERVGALNDRGVGLWDVLASCVRPGSLDGAIVAATEVPNNLGAVLEAHPGVTALAFNGGKAARTFRRRVAPAGVPERVTLLDLPSTSPANAAVRYPELRERWRVLLEVLER